VFVTELSQYLFNKIKNAYKEQSKNQFRFFSNCGVFIVHVPQVTSNGISYNTLFVIDVAEA